MKHVSGRTTRDNPRRFALQMADAVLFLANAAKSSALQNIRQRLLLIHQDLLTISLDGAKGARERKRSESSTLQ
jgi:hypothetical protein